MNTGVSRSKIFGVGEYPSGTFRFKKIDGSFWNGETFRFADYIQSLDGKFIARELFHQLSQFAVSLSHVVVDLLVASVVFLAEGKGG